MNVARLREQYEQTQVLLSEIQAICSDGFASDRAFLKHQNLVKIILLLQAGTQQIQEKESRTIWQERCSNLHQSFIALTSQLLQNKNNSGENFWENCVQLLYLNGKNNIELENKLAKVINELEISKNQIKELQESLQHNIQLKEATVKENLELKTRIVIFQQEKQNKEEDLKEFQSQWKNSFQENEYLKKEKEKYYLEYTKCQEKFDSQSQVISELMKKSERSKRERDEAFEEIEKLNQKNNVLSVNLSQNSQVIEKLIILNQELMDTANHLRLLQEKREKENERLKSSTESDVNELQGNSPSDSFAKETKEKNALKTLIQNGVHVNISRKPIHVGDNDGDLNRDDTDDDAIPVSHNPLSSYGDEKVNAEEGEIMKRKSQTMDTNPLKKSGIMETRDLIFKNPLLVSNADPNHSGFEAESSQKPNANGASEKAKQGDLAEDENTSSEPILISGGKRVEKVLGSVSNRAFQLFSYIAGADKVGS